MARQPPTMTARPAPPDAADADPPVLWVMGGFQMTRNGPGAAAAACVGVAAAAGLSVTALWPQRGGFGDAAVADYAAALPRAARPAGIVALRAVIRAPVRGWARWLAALLRLAARSRRVVLLTEPARPGARRAAQAALIWAFRAAAPGRVRLVPAATDPAALLSGALGLPAPALDTAAAQAAAFRHISATGARVMRLSDAHVAAALDGPAGRALPAEVRADLLALARAGRRLPPAALRAAAAMGAARPGPGAPRAVAHALSPGADGQPRLVAHLALTGRTRRWRRWLRAPARPAALAAPGTAGIALRGLARAPAPGDAAAAAALARPAAPGAALDRAGWLLLLASRPAVPDPESLRAPWACPRLAAAAPAATPAAPPPAAPEVTLTGLAASGTGLSQNFWMSAAALRLAGLAPRLEPVDTAGESLSALPPLAATASAVMRPVRLLHLNADRIPEAILARPGPRETLNIGYLLWELDRIPAQHRLGLQMLDEVWVPSVFLKHVYGRVFDGPVRLMRKGIELPPPGAAAPPPPGVRRFLVVFDEGSTVARKNPLAAVRAFRDAFGARRDVELVIKTAGPAGNAAGDPEGQMEEIRRLAREDPRLRLIRTRVSLPALLGLIASADALVSPHRAEGFGYLPAYALALGVPAIVTDHSGTRDFCTPETAQPVPARMVPVRRGQAPWHAPGARWAEVEHEALVAALRSHDAAPGDLRARAARGRAVIQTDYGMGAQAARYARRLHQLGVLAEDAVPGDRAVPG